MLLGIIKGETRMYVGTYMHYELWFMVAGLIMQAAHLKEKINLMFNGERVSSSLPTY